MLQIPTKVLAAVSRLSRTIVRDMYVIFMITLNGEKGPRSRRQAWLWTPTLRSGRATLMPSSPSTAVALSRVTTVWSARHAKLFVKPPDYLARPQSSSLFRLLWAAVARRNASGPCQAACELRSLLEGTF